MTHAPKAPLTLEDQAFLEKTPVNGKTRLDVAGEFPAFPGMAEADELKMIDGFLTLVFAEDTVTLRNMSEAHV